jgi:hypothetical protein
VRISPNAVRIVGWISASGGLKKPAMSSMPPKTHRPTDRNSCTVFIFEARDFFLKQKYASLHFATKILKKSGIIFITALCSLCSHEQ